MLFISFLLRFFSFVATLCNIGEYKHHVIKPGTYRIISVSTGTAIQTTPNSTSIFPLRVSWKPSSNLTLEAWSLEPGEDHNTFTLTDRNFGRKITQDEKGVHVYSSTSNSSFYTFNRIGSSSRGPTFTVSIPGTGRVWSVNYRNEIDIYWQDDTPVQLFTFQRLRDGEDQWSIIQKDC